MIVLSHRGYWKHPSEKNTMDAFKRSFDLGFGLETDVRDQNGELVIAHDLPIGNCHTFTEFIKLYNQYAKLPLALNVKSDGLQQLFKKEVEAGHLTNYFFFDMSIPDTRWYIAAGLKFFIRESEYEKDLPFYKEADGIWLDEFNSHWITTDKLKKHLDNNKKVCIVSPELHKRNHETEWNEYRKFEHIRKNTHLMICTDYPGDAKTFFNA